MNFSQKVIYIIKYINIDFLHIKNKKGARYRDCICT